MADIAPYMLSDKKLLQGAWKGVSAFLAESEALLYTAAEEGVEILSMLSTEAFPFPDLPCNEKIVVSGDEFRRIAGYEQTRSVVGICRRPHSHDLDELLSHSHRVIIIEDSTNGANVSTIFRIAYAFGIDAILITHSCADPLFRRSARMSKGDVLRVPWLRIGSQRSWASEVIPTLHCHDYLVASLALEESSISLSDLPKVEKLALVMGTEGEGLQSETICQSDLVVKIPMRHGVDSLNVGAAAALAAWQATR